MKRKIVILGSGESGVGAALLAKKMGYEVLVSDKGQIIKKYKIELENAQIPYEEGSHSMDKVLAADEIIKSPGIPEKASIIKEIRQNNIPIISEIEFGYRYAKGKIVAITGSNGKTTTTNLVYHILKNAKLDVAMGGNVGYSFARIVAEGEHDYYVLEISSFQLDDIKTFKPYISLITNITEDHLDRYDYKLENYVASKFKIAQNQDGNDYLIICSDDEETNKYLKKNKINTTMIPFSWSQQTSEGAYTYKNKMIIQIQKKKFSMILQELALSGRHNTYNSMAAGIVSKLLGVRNDVIRDSLQDFKNLEHRLEFVTTVRGVDFINDSKATNINSTWYALESMEKDIVWIAGGVDKGNDYTVLQELVSKRVKAIVCLGKDNEKIHQAFSSVVGCILDTASADEAVKTAYNLAQPGEVVLLSPACASFDLFDNYEDRGRQFKAAAYSL
jgi:UDP-N-acetylmuramoylalanine--D-glutamate ligase